MEILFIGQFSPLLLLPWMWPPLDQLMACCRIQVEVIELFQIANTGKRLGLEGTLAIEGVENDSLEQVSEAHVMVFRQAFQDLYEALFHPHASLNALNNPRFVGHWYHCTTVHDSRSAITCLKISPLAATKQKPGRRRLSYAFDVDKEPTGNTNLAGLCADCQHMRLIQSDRGSTFYMCLKSLNDSNFPKYPRLPVMQCAGYLPSAKT